MVVDFLYFRFRWFRGPSIGEIVRIYTRYDRRAVGFCDNDGELPKMWEKSRVPIYWWANVWFSPFLWPS
ncbi:hypothetical protein DXH95_13120 [Sphingorhabdus pulchriflava]|uniref:Uncharacterized protein n=1 Tax=Sphingorhabdus pulchriflava TaxID=2292257 RepID=A0A371B5J8_9SPHN|nr:hypothetical protein DXH95_13120 [Sphingorhabdus pulchriflava]